MSSQWQSRVITNSTETMMLCYAKTLGNGVYALKWGERYILTAQEDFQRQMVECVKDFGKATIVYDGNKVNRYDDLCHDQSRFFYNQFISVPQLYYDMNGECIPTLNECIKESGVARADIELDKVWRLHGPRLRSEALNGLAIWDQVCAYLDMLQALSEWVHESTAQSVAV